MNHEFTTNSRKVKQIKLETKPTQSTLFIVFVFQLLWSELKRAKNGLAAVVLIW